MNRSGFTLIELLAIIVILGIIGVLFIPNLMNINSDSKKKSSQMLYDNIVTSAELYFEECEYGDLSSTEKYGEYACTFNLDSGEKIIHANLDDLANTGFLKVNDVDKNDSSKKVVIDPKNNKNISKCLIEIRKKRTTISDSQGITHYKTYYVVSDLTNNNICPKTSDYEVNNG